jgi:hypothetical protein
MLKEIYFDVVRMNLDVTMLRFNNSEEARLAYRAIIDTTGPVRGIMLKIKSTSVIMLDRVAGGFLAWGQLVNPFVKEVTAGERYKITLINGKLASRNFYAPVVRTTTALCC